MESEPLVSVLMPAYNSELFIGAAIESILAQTYTHFELLVIDDGSTDKTSDIVTNFGNGDHRVQVFPQLHSGRVGARNRALSIAKGEYIAWLDADDLARPYRLEQQIAALRSNPRQVIVGSAYQEIDANGALQVIHKMPATDTMIRWHCLFHSPFAQSSVMLRQDILRSNGLSYNPAMKEAEDYELWSRLLKFGQGNNFTEPLVEYRVHPTQASRQDQAQLWEHAGRVAQKNLTDLGTPLPLEQVQQLREWYYRFPIRFEDEDLPLAEALLDILSRFSLQPGLDVGEVECIRGRWLGRLLRAVLRSRNKGLGLQLIRRLTPEDLRVVMTFLRSREKLDW